MTYSLVMMQDCAHLTISDAGNNLKNLIVAMKISDKPNSSSLIDDLPDPGIVQNEGNSDNFTADYTQEMAKRIIDKVNLK